MRSYLFKTIGLCFVASTALPAGDEIESSFRELAQARNSGVALVRDLKADLKNKEDLSQARRLYLRSSECYNSYNDSIKLAMTLGNAKLIKDEAFLATCAKNYQTLYDFAVAKIPSPRSPFLSAKDVIELVKIASNTIKAALARKGKAQQDKIEKFFDAARWPDWNVIE